MALTPGTRLGTYDIGSAIGAGGMGEVYRAHDTKLSREVALKILPESFVHDPDRVARFRREAQVLASLNHPHIAAIYGLEEANGSQFLILELVEGETLAQRLKSGPLPVDEALSVARQIADALEAAHEKGIIHRDLKPANIAFTADNQVKVLDFGLAKALEPVGAVAGDMTASPTITTPAMTQMGMILGTAAYMSPEQAKGRPADKRSDVWAFGCVLYEMLTGKGAFECEDVSDTLAAILRDDPAWNVLPRELPTNVRTLLTGCLKKDRTVRFADVAVIQFLLDAPVAVSPSIAGTLAIRATLLAIAAGVGALVAFAIGLGVRPSITPLPVVRLSAAAPPGTPLNVPELGMAVSPDGKRVVFRAGASAATSQLYLREIDRFDAVPLRNTPNPQSPFFSPDGQWIAFFSLGTLKKVAVTGGAPEDICAVPAAARGGTWGSDDTIVFSSSANPGLMRVPAAGGTPKVLAAPPANKGTLYRFPSFMPDGKAVLFTIFQPGSGWDNADVAVVSLDAGDERVVFHGGTRPRYASSGYLLVERAGSIFAVRFDPKGPRRSGRPVLVVDHVSSNSATGVAQYDVSDNGLLAYVPGSPDVPNRNPTWVTRQGNATTVELQRPIVDLALSPDSRRAAFAIAGESTNLFIYNFENRTMPRFTTGSGVDASPRWTRDGQRIAYSATRNGPTEIYWKASDGSGGDEPLAKVDPSGPGQFPRSFSSDGHFLIFQRGQGAASNDLWVLSLGENPTARAFIDSPANETQAQFSPNGHWVAYQSNETDRDEIYIAPFPGPGGRIPVSTDGGQRPLWRDDGRELFYRSGDRVMAVDVNLGQTPRIGMPHMLFQGQYDLAYDVTKDGQRFLMLKGEPQSQPTVLNIIVNWFEELKARVPTK
jgi:serine/threonine-protein kinase